MADNYFSICTQGPITGPTSFKTFYSDGSIKSIKLYEFSEVLYENIIVFQKQFYESGGIKLEKHWDENGLKSGSWIYYNDDEVRDEAGEIIQDATIIEKH